MKTIIPFHRPAGKKTTNLLPGNRRGNQSVHPSHQHTFNSFIQQKHSCPCDGGCPHCLPPQSIATSLDCQLHASKGRGQLLPENDRAAMEKRFNADFSGVRVHTGSYACDMNKALNAQAFTHGTDIYFAAGTYNPTTPSGQWLLSHELTHVVQQTDSRTERIMRHCDCGSLPWARPPAQPEAEALERDFPRLVRGEYCITGPMDTGYNCFAWSVGITDRVVEDEIDIVRDNTVTYAEADHFYSQHQLFPGGTHGNAEVITYGEPGNIKHAARKTRQVCDGEPMWESKLGIFERILHKSSQLEGPAYGNLTGRYYRYMRPSMIYNPEWHDS